jgi:DNA-binding transcriptional LysR family regulator
MDHQVNNARIGDLGVVHLYLIGLRKSCCGACRLVLGGLLHGQTVVFGRMHILPIVTKLLQAHPQLDVHLILVDRVIRLVEEGIDVAVRIADLSDSSLHAIRVAEVRRVLVASPAYLAERGVPAHVSDLLKHDLIAFDSFALNSEWRFTQSGRPAIRCEPRLLTNSVEAIDAAIDVGDRARSQLSGGRSRPRRPAALCLAAVRSAHGAGQSIVPGEPTRIA